jgi:DNA-binding transcriptional ArsR family regulator
MPTPFESLAALDKLIHEPARLAIMTALSGIVDADFLFLERLTGLTRGNLSTHLSKLEEAELLQITKKFVGKKPITLVHLTEKGQQAIDWHWKQLEELKDKARTWQSQTAEE